MSKKKISLLRKGLGSLLVATLGVAGASQSFAAQIIVTDGTATNNVMDNGVGDLSPLAGVVLATGPVGQWNVNVSTGLSTPVLGSPGSANMDLNSVSLATTGATLPVTIAFWDSSFTSTGNIPFASAIGGTVDNADIQWKVCIDDANGVACSATAGSGSFLGEGAFSENFSGLASVTGPFSVGLVVEITPSTGSEVVASFDFQVTQVPLPAGAWLFGSALLGLVAVKRRKA